MLTLFRSRPSVLTTPDRRRPVLLLPGANSNRYTFGVDEDASLAASLNAAGRDVWLVDFRGSRSSHWHGAGAAPVNLDHKIRVDLPSAIEAILGETGADQIDLVGHSLGGLFTYCYCGGPEGSLVGRAVTIAAPATFRRFFGRATPALNTPARLLSPIARRLSGFGVDRLAQASGPMGHLFALRRHMRLGATTRHQRRAWLDHGVEDMPGGDLAQLMRWIGSTELSDGAGGQDYAQRLESVRTPMLVMRPVGDTLVPREAVREAFDRIGTHDKRFLEIGRRHGASRDYSHADVLLSRSAVHDVHPHVVEWLGRAPSSSAESEIRGGTSPAQSAR